jgi:hypothetical protein
MLISDLKSTRGPLKKRLNQAGYQLVDSTVPSSREIIPDTRSVSPDSGNKNRLILPPLCLRRVTLAEGPFHTDELFSFFKAAAVKRNIQATQIIPSPSVTRKNIRGEYWATT